MRLGSELGLEIGIFRAAGPGPVRAAGLGHEPLDHAMEGDAVVEFFASKLLDVRDMGWREIGPHFDDDLPLRGLECERVTGLRHAELLSEWVFPAPAIADARAGVNPRQDRGAKGIGPRRPRPRLRLI